MLEGVGLGDEKGQFIKLQVKHRFGPLVLSQHSVISPWRCGGDTWRRYCQWLAAVVQVVMCRRSRVTGTDD